MDVGIQAGFTLPLCLQEDLQDTSSLPSVGSVVPAAWWPCLLPQRKPYEIQIQGQSLAGRINRKNSRKTLTVKMNRLGEIPHIQKHYEHSKRWWISNIQWHVGCSLFPFAWRLLWKSKIIATIKRKKNNKSDSHPDFFHLW